MTTPFHAKFWAHSLLLSPPRDTAAALSRSIGNARVDLNPHQVDAALFALRSPYSKGVLLADEVGLGKTIEAALILAQKWAERRRRILLIVPATLRKQWQIELEDKFFLPSTILEAKTANALAKKGIANPFLVDDRIVIASYQFVYAKRHQVAQVDWDLVVIDEAHRLRSIYKGTKTAEGIVEVLRDSRKLLLTATPLQNSLLELYGLVSILDPELFGGQEAFQEQFMTTDEPDARDAVLRERIQHVCKRTLRRQVLEYISFTHRFTHTADFVPSREEAQLYEDVSAYLQRDVLVALPNARRKLITLILRKLLASSSAAIAATLSKFVDRLAGPSETKGKPGSAAKEASIEEALAKDFEALDGLDEEWPEEAAPSAPAGEGDAQSPEATAELAELRRFVALAQSVSRDSKATKLVEVLPIAFEKAGEKGAARKAVLFTESRKTQEYLFRLLSENGFAGEIVLMNGENNDEVSKQTYAAWKKRHEGRWNDVTSGSKTADMKAAIVEEFRDRGTLLLATESAAEGVNLQFCSIVINYDLPWNPQRIEQRIGRCHRYGQKSDVLVVNFLNRTNEADRRVFELLDQKFNLFKGVFGASDEVLGVVESGVDLEKRIAAIYQDCRTQDEIKAGFDALQLELDESIKAGMNSARRAFLENFDEEVHERLRMHKEGAKASLDAQQAMLLDLARFGLWGRATFDAEEPRFFVDEGAERGGYHLDWQRAETLGDAFFRVDHELARGIIEGARGAGTPVAEVAFAWDARAAALSRYVGQAGWLSVSKVSAEAIGRTEELLIVAACDEGGVPLAPDVAAKMFSLGGRVVGPVDEATAGSASALEGIRAGIAGERLAELERRDESFFQEEAEKIARRSEDLKMGLEREIKRLGAEITGQQREARKARGLQEKLDAQRMVRTLEARRTEKKRLFFEEEDRIKADHDGLIAGLEKRLAERAVTVENVMMLKWRIVAAAQVDAERAVTA